MSYNNIPAKTLVDNVDVCIPYIAKIENDSVVSKKEETVLENNYRPVSILP